ncbi:unnamed protein product [Bursaphelenchus okinawaensis]|uniref:T-cell immunomodulatory protein TIP C2 domain-containing protein n=1 Tax=Bursaphelenchus okinawaensis TaxID=465554 RepID=A0A811KFA0_9BILA|nr:unnamed protein product [Bursaphelenchus okinawaensis]CAG9103483.1 unnamed protein product [Bursaphelenchus okinawaensis]
MIVLYICTVIWLFPFAYAVSLNIGDDHVPDPQIGRICAYGDVNKDRYTDLVVQKGGKLVFLLQSEEGKFKTSTRHGEINLNGKEEVYCATGDFNGDAALDVLVVSSGNGGEFFKVNVYLNHEGLFTDATNISQTFVEPPSIMDVNGDGTSDIVGMIRRDGSIHSLYCLCGSKAKTFDECHDSFIEGNFSQGPYEGFPHIFVDLDGDLSSEIIFGMKQDKVPLKLMVFKRLGSASWIEKKDMIPDIPDSPDLREFAAPVVSDFNGDLKIDIVIPVCRAVGDCSHIDKFLVWFYGMTKWEQFQLDMKELSFVVEPNSKTVFRVGEFKLDGFPDLIATSVVVNSNRRIETRAPLILENVHADNGNFSRKFDFNIQKDLHLVLPEAMAGANITASSFFDLKEDGNLDVLVEYKDKHGAGTMVDFIKCDDKGDTTFLKVQVFSNVCSYDCPGTPTSDSGSGISWCGACVSYSMDTSFGAPKTAVQCQIPQTTYRTLHSPFLLFGLGRSPNFVNELLLGSPRDPDRKDNQQHFLKQIVPNSRLIVVPPERNESHWQSRLYLTPSTLIIQSLLVQVTVCLILLGLVVGLHMRERRHDRRERQSQSHRFHFDAISPLIAMSRRLYVVRHAEREDNINHNWKKKYPGFKDDNTPLSDRGRSQAKDLLAFFEDIDIRNIYVSPFDRTMETATIFLEGHDNKINVEPGICEALYLCVSPPGFWGVEKLKEKFPLVNLDYDPAFSPPMPNEGYGDSALTPRVRQTINKILDENPGSGNIVLVGHGASIGGVHSALGHGFQYVGQATVSIFDETAPDSKKFKLVESSGVDHLSASNRKNLRAY